MLSRVPCPLRAVVVFAAVMVGITGMARAGDWAGPYAGIVVGGGSFDTSYHHLDLINPDFGIEAGGALVGGIAGYNWRLGNTVLGVEGDIAATNMDGQRAGHPDHVSDVNWIATLRGRAGILVTPKLLVFATGGAAWLDQTFTHVGHHEWDQTYIGWTVGGGLEYAISGNAHLGVDALYMDFGSEQDTHPHGAGTHTIEAEPSGFVARARLTIKIGG